MTRIFGFVLAAAASAILVTAPSASAQDKTAAGAALFSSQKCVLCHSIDGRGNKKGTLDDVAAKLNADQIREWLTHPEQMREKTKATRTPAMKDPKLSKDQVDALVAFLTAKKASKAQQ